MMKRLFKGGTVIQRRNGSQRGRSEKDRSFGKRGKDSCGREKS